MAITSISRNWGNNPSIVKIESTASLTTITTAGYLASQADNIRIINAGNFDWNDNDSILMTYGTSQINGFFQRNPVTELIYPMPTTDGNQTRFNIQLSSPQTILAGNSDPLIFDTKVFDKSNNFDTSTYIMTAPENGYYQLFGQVILTATSPITIGGVNIVFIKNGSDLVAIGGTNSLLNTLPGLYVGGAACNGFVYLNKDDTLVANLFNQTDVDVTTFIPLPELNILTCYSLPL